MKSQTMAVFTTVLSVLLSDPASSHGQILQLNAETGKLARFTPNEEQTHKAVTPVSLPTPARKFQRSAIIQPAQTILDQIEATARSYSSAKALADANLSVQEWMALFRANIEIESSYNPKATSKVGAFGLGQLRPETATHLKVNIHDPADNLRGSAEYLLNLLGTFGSPGLAIAAYNAGSAAVTKNGGVPPYLETREHVSKVLSAFFRLRNHYL